MEILKEVLGDVAQPAPAPDVTHLGSNVYMVRVDASYDEREAVAVARLESNLDWKKRVIGAQKRVHYAMLDEHGKIEATPTQAPALASKSLASAMADVLGILFLSLCIAYIVMLIVCTFSQTKGGA